MALVGTHTRNLDEKQRLAVPKPLREAFGEESDTKCLYVAPGTEQCLLLYSSKGFDDFAKQIASQSRNSPSIRNYMRLFYAQAEQLSLDSQGRVRIPDRLAKYAGLEREIVVVGVLDHAEIWDQPRWNEFMNHNGPSFDELASRALDWS